MSSTRTRDPDRQLQYVSRADRHGGEDHATIRVALVQQRLPSFRAPVFNRLGRLPDIDLTLYTGSPVAPDAHPCYRVVTVSAVTVGGKELMLAQRLLWRTLRGHYDVVVCEGGLSVLPSVVLTLGRRLFRTPVVWWTSLYDARREKVAFPGGLRGLGAKLIIRRASACVTYSERAARAIRAANVEGDRVFVAPNALDTDLLAACDAEWRARPRARAEFSEQHGLGGRTVVLFIGRLTRRKRVDELVRAFELVRAWHARARPLLVIVGDGPMRAGLHRQVRELGLAGDVRFVGEIRALEGVCPFFLAATVCVLPGSGGLAIYQALAHGIPTVASSADGTEEDLLRPGVNGYLFPLGDVDQCADRIAKVVAAPAERWTSMSNAARAATHGDAHVRDMVASLGRAAAFACGDVSGRRGR